MNTSQHTVNTGDVKRYASWVLQSTLNFVAFNTRFPVKALIDMMLAAAVRCSSIEQTCQKYKNAPSGKTVRTHIALQLESLHDAEVRINRAMRRHLPKRFRRKPIKLAIDYVEICYYGRRTKKIRRSCPKHGTSSFHTYASAYVVEKGQRYTLALTYVTADDSVLDVLRRLNKRLNELCVRVELYLLDRGYYCVEVVKWFTRYMKPFIMPVIVRGKESDEYHDATGTRALKESNQSRWDIYTMTSPEHGDVTFQVAICCTNYNGKQKKTGRRTFVYATFGVSEHSLTWVRETYRLRFGIETSHRQMREMRIKTSTTNLAVRLLYIGVSFVLRNVWVWMHWNVFRRVQRGPGGRKIVLSQFTIDTLKTWIRSAMSEAYILKKEISVSAPLPAEILQFR